MVLSARVYSWYVVFFVMISSPSAVKPLSMRELFEFEVVEARLRMTSAGSRGKRVRSTYRPLISIGIWRELLSRASMILSSREEE